MKLSTRFDEALRWSSEIHRGQTRKGTEVPYVSHPLGVASLVLEHGGGEDEAIAALLHDAVEDNPAITFAMVRERFGDVVARIVEGCSDSHTHPKPPYRQRKEAYLAHLATADAATRLVSMADKVYNARAILADYRRLGDALWSRFTAGRDGVLWYYRALVTAFRAHGPHPLVDELDGLITELEARAAP